MFSVQEQWLGRAVFLTGGLGGVGSVCLEQLLRKTEVESVFLLARARGSLTAVQRVQKLLSGPLFHVLHKEAVNGARNVFKKVHVIEGDMLQPDLGLSAADQQLVLEQTHVVLHCAADVALQAPIQRTLKVNYSGTQKLLDLASKMQQLQSFVHVSTFYVNNFKPYNSEVKEEVHVLPLHRPGHSESLTHSQLAKLLLSLEPDKADSEAQAIMARLNFTSTYAFSKLLTEQMVDDATTLPGVPKVIVRPSLVFGAAAEPFPGYWGGFAGPGSYVLGYGAGFIHSIKGLAFASDACVDLIPVDIITCLVITAAAAAMASGPMPGNSARVYHACSAACQPMMAPEVMQRLHTFFSANPCQLRLPFGSLPYFTGPHVPTEASLTLSRKVSQLKLQLAVLLLRISGRSSRARMLKVGFKTFCAQNTPSYARSFVSLVGNAQALQDSLASDEADAWRCVADENAAPWAQVVPAALAGLMCKAFKVPPSSIKTNPPHMFVQQPGLADPCMMQEWMAAASCPVPAGMGAAAGMLSN